MILADSAPGAALQLAASAIVFLAAGSAVLLGGGPLLAVIRRREQRYGAVLRYNLLLDVSDRSVTALTGLAMFMLAALAYLALRSVLAVVIALAVGAMLPPLIIRLLRKRRLDRLDEQLVGGIQTLASGVRAGLNLVQSMEMIARDGAVPLRQEFAHLLREYEYGMPLEEAMSHAADRIGSGDFRLLFAALLTHRERGGDLGETLDRIAESIREIQRLENRVRTLTAQGRASARWMGIMPLVLLGIYYLIEPNGVRQLFIDDLGKLILLAMATMNVVGFLWVKEVVSIDI